MKLTAACLLLLCCELSFGANISFRGIAEGSHTYSPISGSTGGGGIGSFLVNTNQFTTNGGVLSTLDGANLTNINHYVTLHLNNFDGSSTYNLKVNNEGTFSFFAPTTGEVYKYYPSSNAFNFISQPSLYNIDGINANSLVIQNGANFVNGPVTLANLPTLSILRTDGSRAIDTISIGSGLSFDGATLSASGGSLTPWISDINGAGFSLTNANNLQANVIFLNTNRNSYISNDAPRGRVFHYSSNTLTFVEDSLTTAGGLGIGTNAHQGYRLNVASGGTIGSLAAAAGSFLVDNSGNITATSLGGSIGNTIGSAVVPWTLNGTNSLFVGNTTNLNSLWIGSGIGATIQSNSAGTFSIQTSNSTSSKLYQTTTGVGIGTNAPGVAFEIQGALNSSSTIKSTTAGGTDSIGNGQLILQSTVVIDTSQRYKRLDNGAIWFNGNTGVASNLTAVHTTGRITSGDAYIPTNAAPVTFVTAPVTTLMTNRNQRALLVIKLAFDDVTGGIPSCTLTDTNTIATNSWGVLSPTLSGLTLVGTVTITNDYMYPMLTNGIMKVTDTSSGGAAVRVVQVTVAEH